MDQLATAPFDRKLTCKPRAKTGAHERLPSAEQVAALLAVNSVPAMACRKAGRSSDMTVMAKMLRDRRAAVRNSTAFGMPIDDADANPTSVLVDEISVVGFRMLAGVPMADGDEITIQLPEMLPRAAMIVRQSGLRFGCTFICQITNGELQAILAAGAEADARREQRAATGWRPGRAEAA